jgi:sugar lactone lactonase YvrE
VEVDPAGYLYADDLFTGRVVRLTLATGELVELATVADASGMALSLDRRTLYVNSWFESDVYAVPLGPDGATGAPVRVVDLPAVHGLDDLALDACGNLYLAGYYSKQVLRAEPATGEVVVLAEVTDPELMVSGLEWGRGVGGFGEEQLHVSNPWCCHFDRMLVLEVGVPGRPR